VRAKPWLGEAVTVTVAPLGSAATLSSMPRTGMTS